MANIRAKVIFVGALIVGLLSLLILQGWSDKSAPSAPRQILVAVSDLKAGTRLTSKDFKPKSLSAVPAGAFEDPRAVDGRLLVQDVAAETVFVDDMLAAVGKVEGLAAVIAPGTRAMTVRVNDVVGVAGFALPGNYVDVIVNTEERNVQDAARKSVSKIVLEKVLVLAVAQEARRDDAAPKVVNAVTLQVSPQQAESIDLARSIGSLSLVLRNQLDQESAHTNGATQATLLDRTSPAEVKLDAPRRAVVHRNCTPVISGTGVVRECW